GAGHHHGSVQGLPLAAAAAAPGLLGSSGSGLPGGGGPSEGSAIGEELLCCAEELFTWWHRVRDGTLSRATLRRYVAELRPWVRSQLEAGRDCGCAKTAGTCRELLAVEPALWTFVGGGGVEPTNNHIERLLRPAVLWRKRSFGSQSASGCRWVERLLTVVQTRRLQGRSVLDYLYEAIAAHRAGLPAPRLL